MTPIRLTSLAHGGGCGCKLAPSILQKMLKNQPSFGPFEHLLVGTDTNDDAAVYALDDETCIIATTDFFMPMVDNAKTFGQIAATNAISDIYAMGGKPIMALAILGMPIDNLFAFVVAYIFWGVFLHVVEAVFAVSGCRCLYCAVLFSGVVVLCFCLSSFLLCHYAALLGDLLVLFGAFGVVLSSSAFRSVCLSYHAFCGLLILLLELRAVVIDFVYQFCVFVFSFVAGFVILVDSFYMAEGFFFEIWFIFSKFPFFSPCPIFLPLGFLTVFSVGFCVCYGVEMLLRVWLFYF
ncbi:selenide, water dikinase [Bartonella tamiae Th307]|nr:selenide, water dikinase [Bartonella tamiae Th307]